MGSAPSQTKNQQTGSVVVIPALGVKSPKRTRSAEPVTRKNTKPDPLQPDSNQPLDIMISYSHADTDAMNKLRGMDSILPHPFTPHQ